ncbi:protein mono-ADP-ribosyltransferase PARP12-like isoform X1 [Pseudoliparis swirei]|uniref:protein mono-ADP-ribosyltransferase PARP12-like isoform X1 n=1 Tax=Pseudoliparis swirei TaxID=2059687 RepID=UPI0024BEDC34|nr:protein mono-ADP-ribosyltransferase PARP12-like isoform X1 [Pseudoliparis swirei]
MASNISNFVTKTLCDHQGSLDFKRLEEEIGKYVTVSDAVLRRVLFDDAKVAIQGGRQEAAGGALLSPDSLLVAKTSLRVCQKKPGECAQCDGLHLCRHYVCGVCTFGSKCKKTHSLSHPHNAGILKQHGLHDLTEKQLFQLLLQNDPSLLPEVCQHYNKGNGQHGSCKFPDSCTKLHVCHHHFHGDCKFGPSCKRSHSVDAQEEKVLRGISQENIKNLLEIYRNKFIILGQHERPAVPGKVLPEVRSPTQQLCPKTPGSATGPPFPAKPISDADRNEICLFFIRRHCSFNDRCARVHWHLPFRWQVLDGDGVTWKDLPKMEDIEKAYCEPGNDTSSTDPLSATMAVLRDLSFRRCSSESPPCVDFMTMTHGGSPVRRLSTVSSISKPPHFILTTQWLWYWKDDSGIWLEFGQSDDGVPASVTSQTLENVYLADRDTEIPFAAGKQQYVLDLKGAAGTQQMFQMNVKYKTKREVRRRPRFVSSQDVEVKLSSASTHGASSSTAESFPSHWDTTALPDFGYKLVPLPTSAIEYKRIEKLFKLTMPKSRLNSIQRVQNPSLWKVFQWQKEQMKERNGATSGNEDYLFHGTDESLIEAICEQNFDWRMCGVHGTLYGKGSYFARDASYSDRYAASKSLNKIMFVALVLVGEFTEGISSDVRPPPKGNGKTLYDSCVDSESNPSIYVVFEKLQIYPEYLIDYS